MRILLELFLTIQNKQSSSKPILTIGNRTKKMKYPIVKIGLKLDCLFFG